MATIVCPTVTARSVKDFELQLKEISPKAKRIHIDLGDGVFTSELLRYDAVDWPSDVLIDVHVMYQRPAQILPQLIARRPHLIILHAESNGHIAELLKIIAEHGIKAGVALLQETSIVDARNLIMFADHLQIFSGKLGHFGGAGDLKLLQKVARAKVMRPDIEIGWDGGIRADNIQELARGGVDVLNVGGAIHRVAEPYAAYEMLSRLVDA
jgi:ribulose-phosphate 3-epimerase